MWHYKFLCSFRKACSFEDLLKHKDFSDVFLELGSSDELKDTTLVKLEEFTCLLYKKCLASDDDIHKLWYDQFKRKFSPKQGMLLHAMMESTWVFFLIVEPKWKCI